MKQLLQKNQAYVTTKNVGEAIFITKNKSLQVCQDFNNVSFFFQK